MADFEHARRVCFGLSVGTCCFCAFLPGRPGAIGVRTGSAYHPFKCIKSAVVGNDDDDDHESGSKR